MRAMYPAKKKKDFFYLIADGSITLWNLMPYVRKCEKSFIECIKTIPPVFDEFLIKFLRIN